MVRCSFNSDNTITLRLTGGVQKKCRKICDFKDSLKGENYIMLSPLGHDEKYIYRCRKGDQYVELGSLDDSELRRVSQDYETQTARRAAAALAARQSIQTKQKSAGGSLLKGALKIGAALAIGDIVGDIISGDDVGLDIFDNTSGADVASATALADISSVDMSDVSFGEYDFNGDGIISDSEFQTAAGDWMDSVDGGTVETTGIAVDSVSSGGDMSGVSFEEYDLNGDGIISESELQMATNDWMNSKE